MKKAFRFFAILLVLIISMSLTISAFAASGSLQVSCEGTNFSWSFAEGEEGQLEITLYQGNTWTGPTFQNETILVSGSGSTFVPWAVSDVDGLAYRVAVRLGHDPNSGVLAVEETLLNCPPPPPPGGEGCTPGYWRNHFEDWPPTGYSPSDSFAAVFGIDLGYATLGDAIVAKGGGDGRLARHGTAALLSAAHPDVDYPYTVAEVIAFVQAGDADPLVTANELGCQIP